MTHRPENIVGKPRLLFRPDPVLGWGLTPDHCVRVGFRDDVIQRIGPDGWRCVPGAGNTDRPNLAIYGCSFTYGTGLADDETFTALLQHDLPELNILNRGVGGHGTVQNLLQFRRDIAKGLVDAAVFAIISDHRFRNVAHPVRMQAFLNPEWYTLGVEHVPVMRREQSGQVRIEYIKLWQPILQRGGFNVFLPDEYMVTAATLAVLEEVTAFAATHRIPIRFALLDQLDPAFNSVVTARFPTTLDVSVPHDADHAFLPMDIHPNVKANQLFATRLRPAVEALSQEFIHGRQP